MNNQSSLISRLCLAFFILNACLAAAWAAPTGTQMVAMSDGARLATDWYLPDSGGPAYPVVLTRTYYDKTPLGDTAAACNAVGYAFVAQDVRGRFASEGSSSGWLDDGWSDNQDGAETVAWIQAQPWCDGNVATMGGSALGIAQLMLAGASQDVACQSVGVAASNLYRQAGYQGGVFRKSLIEGWATGVGEPQIIALYKAHPTYDAFWELHNTEARAPYVTAPGLHYGGWFDIFQQGTINAFVTRQHNGADGARGNQKLVIGPWAHGFSETVGELTFPDSLNVDLFGLEARLFEYWLKGVENGVVDEPAVRYYTIGAVGDPDVPGNEWRTANDWPPFETYDRALYLHADGRLDTSAPSETSASRSFTFNPADPCPTRGGQNLVMPAGPMDQRPLSGRSDVLTFASDPLPEPIEVTGNVRVRLYVSTDAPDTDFTAKLVDVYPDGREMLMLDGIRRLKFRDGFTSANPLSPGQTAVIEIELWSISIIFNAGHRIGLHVSSSNHPRFEVNPNTGDDFPSFKALQIAHNTVHMDSAYPSALILPFRDPDAEIAETPAANLLGLLALTLMIAAAARRIMPN